MPKQKTHSGAKKRFTLTSDGKIKRGRQGHRHILTKKTRKRKRSLRKVDYISPSFEKNVKELLNS